MNNKNQIKWINFARLIAIIAVIVDHTNGYLYSNQDIVKASYFSVSLFILISGMTSYISYSHRNENWIKSIIRGCKKISIAYIISVFIIGIYVNRFFDFLDFLKNLVYFNISGPHYYVLLYIQLMIVGPILFNLLKSFDKNKYTKLYEIITFVIVVIVSSYTIRYTNILGIYGGGGKLFGGTYLILFYIGMLISKYKIFEEFSYLKSSISFVFGSIAWFFWWRYLCDTGSIIDSYFLFGNGLNPPGVSLMVLASFTLVACYGFFTLLEKIDIASRLVLFISWLGSHTLYVFLYHLLLLHHFIMPNLKFDNIWILRIFTLLLIFVGSFIIEFTLEYVIKKLKEIME